MAIGHPCSSFVFMNQATSGRSDGNPEGDTSKSYVALANSMAMRTAILCIICFCRGVHFKVEQPHSSKLFALKCMEFVAGLCRQAGIPFYKSFLWGP